jgi:hypothetical protein
MSKLCLKVPELSVPGSSRQHLPPEFGQGSGLLIARTVCAEIIFLRLATPLLPVQAKLKQLATGATAPLRTPAAQLLHAPLLPLLRTRYYPKTLKHLVLTTCVESLPLSAPNLKDLHPPQA